MNPQQFVAATITRAAWQHVQAIVMYTVSVAWSQADTIIKEQIFAYSYS